MKLVIDRNADRLDYADCDLSAEEIKLERSLRLLAVCPKDRLNAFDEWIEDEGWQLYWNDGWINGRRLVSLATLYKEFANA